MTLHTHVFSIPNRMAHEDMNTHVAADEVHEEDNDLKEAPKATSGNKTYNAAELSKKVRKLESLFTEFKTTILYLQNQNMSWKSRSRDSRNLWHQ